MDPRHDLRAHFDLSGATTAQTIPGVALRCLTHEADA